jgi:hypothetical protein
MHTSTIPGIDTIPSLKPLMQRSSIETPPTETQPVHALPSQSKQYNRIDAVRGEEVATYAVDVPGTPMQRKVRDAIALWNKRSLQEQDGGMATSTSTSILPTIPELSTPLQSQPTQLNSVNVHLSRKELKLKFGLQFTEVKSDGSRLKLCLKSITPNSLVRLTCADPVPPTRPALH